MKKFLTVLLFVCIIPHVYAETDGSTGFRLDLGGGVSASINSVYATAMPRLMYDTGIFAAGIGSKTYFGLMYGDIYEAVFATAEFGWFYLSGGASFMLKTPDPEKSATGYATPASDPPVYGFLSAGANIPVVEIGPGKLCADLSLDIFPSASPVRIVDDTDSVAGNIFATIIVTAFSAALDLAKLNATIAYELVF